MTWQYRLFYVLVMAMLFVEWVGCAEIRMVVQEKKKSKSVMELGMLVCLLNERNSGKWIVLKAPVGFHREMWVRS